MAAASPQCSKQVSGVKAVGAGLSGLLIGRHTRESAGARGWDGDLEAGIRPLRFEMFHSSYHG